MKYDTILWDWNGTLLNDVDVVVGANNVMFKNYGVPCVEREKYLETFGFPVYDYYVKLGVDFNDIDFATLADDFTRIYEELGGDCGCQPGALETVSDFRRAGLKQYVLSASDSDVLARQLIRLGFDGLFDGVCAAEDRQGASKTQRSLTWLKERGVDISSALFVGDTLHDAEVALALGTDCALLSHGHQAAHRLAAAGCPVFASLDGIRDFVMK